MLAAAAVVGAAMRVWVLRLPVGVVDADEAVVGLMARRIAFDGDFPLMYWGQAYGGTLEQAVTAGLFSLFGSSVLVLKASAILQSTVATLLLVPAGARLVGRRAARLGAAAFWVSTANYVIWSTRARGFYWFVMILGLLVILLATTVAERPERWRWWVALGLVAGLGWWTNPQIVYFLLPAGLWLVWRLRAEVWRAVAAAPAFVVGAAPWFAWNLAHDWASLDPTRQPVPFSYVANFERFVTNGVPVALGLVGPLGWFLSVAFKTLYVALVLATLIAVVRARKRLHLLLLLVLVTYPFLFAAFPQSWAIGEGRYVLFFAPFLWLLFATAIRSIRVAAVALTGVSALTVATMGAVAKAGPYAPDVPMPERTAALVRDLRRHDDRLVWANYWVAYRITFESDEQVVATPLPGEQTRYQPYADRVERSAQPTWVFVSGSRTEADFAARADAAPGCWQRSVIEAFVVYRRATGAPPAAYCKSVTG